MKEVKNSVIQLTKMMSENEKFAFLNISKSSIIGLNKKSEKSFPPEVSKEIVKSINLNGPRIMKSVSPDLAAEIRDDRHSAIGLKSNHKYYSPNLFEHYFQTDKYIFDSIVQFFIKNTSNVVVSLHDQKRVANILGIRYNIINVGYHSLYKRFEETYNQIAQYNGKAEYCLLDCSSLGLALASKIWENLDMSIIDLGKALNFTKEYSLAAKNESR
jgi:hypothetical protein